MATIKNIKGFVTDGEFMKATDVTVVFTSNYAGETLSLQAGEVSIGIPFDELTKILSKERRKK